jgi:outer membrane lipoprotein-sorting protein
MPASVMQKISRCIVVTAMVSAAGLATGARASVDVGVMEAAMSALVPAVQAADANEAKQVLERSAEAILRVQSLSYSMRMSATGAFESYSPTVQGRVMMRRPEPGAAWQIRSTGTGRNTATQPEIQFDIAWLGASTHWIDNDKKKLFERPANAARDVKVTVAAPTRPPQITDSRPFAKELGMAEFALDAERVTVDGVECYVVTASSQTGRGAKNRWSIGVNDLLPRKYENVFAGGELEGSITMEFTEVKADGGVTPEQLALTLPEGFERDVQEPPPPPPPMPVAEPVASPTDEALKQGSAADGSEIVKFDAGGAEVGKPDVAGVVSPAGVSAAGAATQSVPAPRVVEPHSFPTALPEFEVKTSTGETLNNATFKNTVALLEFSGSWSIPARGARARIGELAARFEGQPLKVLSLFVREKSPTAGAEFFTQAGHTWPVATTADAFARAMKVRTYPTLMVIGPDGAVLRVIENFDAEKSPGELAEAIEKGLAAVQK